MNGNEAAKKIGNLRRGKHLVWAGGGIVKRVVRNRERPNAIYLFLVDRFGKPCGAFTMQADENYEIEPIYTVDYVVISKGVQS